MQVIAIGKAIAKRVAWPQLNCFTGNYHMAEGIMRWSGAKSDTKSHRTKRKTIVLAMKLTAIILLAGCLQLSARGVGQTISLSLKDAPLMKVFREIERQTDYTFFYKWDRLENAKKVTISVKNLPLNQVLDLCFKDQPFTYSISGKTITIDTKKDKADKDARTSAYQAPLIDVKGRVVNSKGEPVSNATVSVQGTNKGTTTDADGNFSLIGIDEDAVIVISHVQYESETITLNGHGIVNATLQIKVNNLDELQVIAYGTTTKRLNTGNVATVKSTEIVKQPVNNPLLALEGRVPGLFITQTTGMPGGGIRVRIQGQNSLSNGSDPLYVIDGVPYPQKLMPNLATNFLVLGDFGGSPFSFINPADIESIEVLKDADATSIYGSRAAAGAILITTKKGKAGKTKVDFNVQTGWGKIARKLDLMNTSQYLEMRGEAIQNDGKQIPNISTAPNDLNYDINGVWDQTRNTDWQKELLGGTARYNDYQFSVSGGSNNTSFSVGTGYHKETTVFPGNLSDQKGSLRFNINNTSTNQKFRTQLSGLYMFDNNRLIAQDLTLWALRLSPDAPALYNSDGTLNWAQHNGVSTWYNPLTYLNQTYTNKSYNLVTNAIISYEITKGLNIQSSFGYTNLTTNETALVSPTATYAPENRTTINRESDFANGTITSYIIEPQATYNLSLGKGKIEMLLGSTFLQQSQNNQRLVGTGFSSDLLMSDIKSAPNVSVSSTLSSTYRYSAFFGRLNYNFSDRYILDLTARRDGSSRFGSNNLFHNFGSVGAAWLFSNEAFFQKTFPFLSFGKLRGSYGTTGNDQIGDYQFMNLYTSNNGAVSYGGGSSLAPNSTVPNPYLQWEETKKLQFGLDLGFFGDRILLNAGYYLNRSSNQLQRYSIPLFTGRSSVLINYAATIQNNGWELALNTVNFRNAAFTWSTNINLTIPKNKLLSYQGLETSTAANTLVVGKPITIIKAVHYLDVNSTTGLFEYLDEKGNPTSGSPDPNKANTSIINISPKFYGGFQNNLQYKGFELSVLFQFTKQISKNYFYGNYPGKFSSGAMSFSTGTNNQPVWILNRWQKAGDQSSFQKLSSTYPIAVLLPYAYTANLSDAAYSDGSFIRLKNLSLSWQLPSRVKQKMHLQNARLFLQGQNLWTITNYKGVDPENQSINNLPPLKVITIGAQITL